MNQTIEVLANLPGIAAAWALASHPPVGWIVAALGSAAMVLAGVWRLNQRRTYVDQ